MDQKGDPEEALTTSPGNGSSGDSDFAKVSDGSFRPAFAEMEEMSMDASSSQDEDDEDRSPPWTPGDGIVPTIPQFNTIFYETKHTWSSAANAGRTRKSKKIDMASFIELFKDVPCLLQGATSSAIKCDSNDSLTADIVMHVRTTMATDCETPERRLKFYQVIGCSQPYRYIKSSDAARYFPVNHTEMARCFSSIVLAWSYIFSCKWVQLLQSLGKPAVLKHEAGASLEAGFWDLVTRSRWTAQMDGETPIYSPWMIRESKRKISNGRQLNTSEPQADLAYDILHDFCVINGHEEGLCAGFVSFLLIRTLESPPIILAPPMKISHIYDSKNDKSLAGHDLHDVINKGMFLSSVFNSGASILGSTVFDPMIPCNAVGASSQGIIDAVLPNLKTEDLPNPQLDFNDLSMFLDAVAYKSPTTYAIWLAAAYTGKAGSILALTLTYLPPIHLPTAIMTNIHQTFLQCTHGIGSIAANVISRAYEMSLSYWIRNEAWVPWSAVPPFGVTPMNNVSLEITEHLTHSHRPISWKLHFTSANDKEITSSGDMPCRVWTTPQPTIQTDQKSGIEYACSTRAKRAAENQSAEATVRLYNWHRTTDGGLWLASGDNDNPDEVRGLNNHAWMLEPYQEISIPMSGEEEPRVQSQENTKVAGCSGG